LIVIEDGKCGKKCLEDYGDRCEIWLKLSNASDWKHLDFNCGDTADCPKEEMTTVANDQSGTGRMVVPRALAAFTSLLSIPVYYSAPH